MSNREMQAAKVRANATWTYKHLQKEYTILFAAGKVLQALKIEHKAIKLQVKHNL